MKTYTMYSDPGHGWLKISRKDLNELNIADKITNCSYMRKDSVYLEEDLDFSTWMNAMKEKGFEPNKDFKIKEMCTNKSSKIRSYRNYVKV